MHTGLIGRTLLWMGYCFYCDRAVEGETCPTCGRPTWIESRVTAEAPAEPPSQQEPVPESRFARTFRRLVEALREPQPWMIAVAVVAVGLILSILTIPSGFQQITEPETPPPFPTTTTTTIPRPGSTRPSYPLPNGTWIGIVSRETPPQTLTGTFPFLEPAEDVLPNGSLITRTAGTYEVVGPDGLHNDLPIGAPNHLVDVALSPNGQLLATLDPSGQVTVWNIASNSSTELESVTFADSITTADIRWAPDSATIGIDVPGHRFYIWSVDGQLIYGPADGRLLAIGTNAAIVDSSDSLRLQRLDGSFTEVRGASEVRAAAFDPSGRYIAIDATISTDAGSGDGVWIIDRSDFGQDLVAPPVSTFAWSGDGAALYWADPTGTYVYPVGSEYSQARISSRGAQEGDRLRIYDTALVAQPTFLVRSGNLYELRGGRLSRRTPGSVTELEAISGTTASILNGSPLDPTAPLIRSVEYEDTTSTVSLVDSIGATARLLAILPSESRYASSVLDVPDIGTFIGTDDGQVLEVTPDQTTVHVLDGHSPGMVGSVPFAVTDDSIVRLPRDGENLDQTPDTGSSTTAPAQVESLVGVGDLTGASNLLDAIGIRFDLLTLARTRVGTAAIYWIPGDSELLGDAVLPNSPAPNPTAFSLLATPFDNKTIDSGRLLMAGDDQTFAVELHSSEGIQTILMVDPKPGQLACGGAIICAIRTIDGRALGFSPDGTWLLMDVDGEYTAISTKGRGVVSLGESPPDQVVWVP